MPSAEEYSGLPIEARLSRLDETPRELEGAISGKTDKELSVRPDGRLWSIHLESFLVPDGSYLRLEDQYGQRHLTRAEAEARRAEAAERRAEAEAKQAEAEKRRAEALAEKLRSLGIDPDQI